MNDQDVTEAMTEEFKRTEAPRAERLPALRRETPMELSSADVVAQVRKVQEVMAAVMKEGEHYGTIPGCGPKPALLKPGAEKLGLTFRLAPSFDIQERDLDGLHREYRVVCTLKNIVSGQNWGQGVGICSTMETKYRWRKGERKCPKCGKPSIIKGRKEYGGGWLCWQKARDPGCGATFPDDAQEIVSQTTERAENPDISDTYNTVLKMAKKRAHVDAILTATAASDIFTQDIEETDDRAASVASGPQRAPVADSTADADGAALMTAMKAVHAKAHEKGLTHDDLHRECNAHFGLASLTDASVDELRELWKIVAAMPAPPVGSVAKKKLADAAHEAARAATERGEA